MRDVKPMKRPDLDEDDLSHLIDLLLDSRLSLQQIADELNLSMKQVNDSIASLGLTWAKSSRKKMSRGQTALTDIMKKLFPGEEIVNEYHIGERLRLDVYCPKYALAAEFHGRQHFYYTSLFFESKYEFEEAQKRDQRKAELCSELGITLVVFRYNDLLTEDAVYNRLLEAIRSSTSGGARDKVLGKTKSAYYLERKKKHSEYKKQVYRKIKDDRSRRN